MEKDKLPSSTNGKALVTISFSELIIGCAAVFIATVYCTNQVGNENANNLITMNAFVKLAATGSYNFY